MLMRADPFRELDRLAQHMTGAPHGTRSRPTPMPMDAYRDGDTFTVCFDLPGVDPAKIDLNVERNVLTVRAERRLASVAAGVEIQVLERPSGVFSRQLFLDNLDTDRIEAEYTAGVLTLRIPVADRVKPRRIAIGNSAGERTSAERATDDRK